MKRKLGQQYFYKIDFKIKTINKRHTKALHNHKGVNPTRQCNIFNIYTSNTGATEYIKQVLMDMKKEVLNTKIVKDFNMPRT